MKKLLLSMAMAVATLTVSAQSIEMDATTGKYKLQAVEEVNPELTQDQLFAKAKQWIALNYKSANDVIQLDDKEEGKIICKGNFALKQSLLLTGRIAHTLVLDFKDGKFRYNFTDFVHISPDNNTYAYEKKWAKGMRTKANAEIEQKATAAMASLKEYVSGGAASDQDW